MPLIIVLLVALTASAYFLSEIELSNSEQFFVAESKALVANISVYRNAVTSFVDIHPGFDGTVPDSQLSLPAWYRKFPELNNTVYAGRAYIFLPPRSGLLALLDEHFESLLVGSNVSGSFVSYRAAGSNLMLPSSIPDKSVVIVR